MLSPPQLPTNPSAASSTPGRWPPSAPSSPSLAQLFNSPLFPRPYPHTPHPARRLMRQQLAEALVNPHDSPLLRIVHVRLLYSKHSRTKPAYLSRPPQRSSHPPPPPRREGDRWLKSIRDRLWEVSEHSGLERYFELGPEPIISEASDYLRLTPTQRVAGGVGGSLTTAAVSVTLFLRLVRVRRRRNCAILRADKRTPPPSPIPLLRMTYSKV
jgi:hypothetical protein